MSSPLAKDGKTPKCKSVASYFLPVPKDWDFEKSSHTTEHVRLTVEHLTNGLLSLEEEYATFFPYMGSDVVDWDDMKVDGKDARSPYPYDVLIYDRYMKRPKRCPMCGTWNNNHSCLLQYDKHIRIQDILERLPTPVGQDPSWPGLHKNQSFYLRPGTGGAGSGDLILNLVWHQDFQKDFIKGLSYMQQAAKDGKHQHDLSPDELPQKKRLKQGEKIV